MNEQKKSFYMQRTWAFILFTMISATSFSQEKHSFRIKEGAFLYDNKSIQIHSGEMHFARIPEQYWRHRLKMIKAMGLNTVASYVFWNYHETSPGVWDFETGNRNISKFIQIAGEEGLMVILRPGPYACAEWEFGGYPWWLQKNKDLVIRGNNKAFLDSCKNYFARLAKEVKHLQITKGGPVIMVQAENEFGSYVNQRKDIPLKEHKAYNAAIRKIMLDSGFDVPLFTSDGSWLFEGGATEGALPTANGENNIENLKKVVNQYHNGQGPYMVAEFYPGWLDHWNEPFIRVPIEKTVNQMENFLKEKISFNFYMAHGGTNFAFTSGANYDKKRDIQPDITSYDYDAPISEAGWVTPKYTAIRNKLKEYVNYAIPEPPPSIPIIQTSPVQLNKTVDLFEMITSLRPVNSDNPLTFEALNQGYGYVMYSRTFNQPISGELHIEGLRDYALIYVNGEKVAELNRMTKTYSCNIEIPFNARLDILVENMGRINYGAEIVNNLKGIISPVKINDIEITGDWKMYPLPMDTVPDLQKYKDSYEVGLPVLYHGTFTLAETGDTFLDMTEWGKGIVFVNGHNLGRYWKTGPQQTLYLPGCWLKKGENSVTVFEQQNDVKKAELRTVKVPELESLSPLHN